MVNWCRLRRQLIGDFDPGKIPPRIEVPVLPRALNDFIQRAEQPDVTALELGKCIESDVGLTCELLRLVNSSALGIRDKASTAQRAISVLGVHRSKLTLLTAAVQKYLKPREFRDFDYDGFCAANLERALFAQHFAKAFRTDADLAFAGAMLVDCLIPKLDDELPGFYPVFAETSPQTKPRLIDHEERALGWTHAMAAAQIMLGWKFPDDLICCVALHHCPENTIQHAELKTSAAAAVALAALAPDPLMQEPHGLPTLLNLGLIIPGMNFEIVAAAVAQEFIAAGVPKGKHLLVADRSAQPGPARERREVAVST